MSINHNDSLSWIEIAPVLPAKWTVIWLHGLGADGNDFASLPMQLQLESSQNIRFIFPHAPIIPVTLNNGYQMRAWFDIYGITQDARIDTPGIERSAKSVAKLIETEIMRGIPAQHIFIAGYSQGAAMAIITGLGYPQTLAGIIALSGFLPLASEVLQKASLANRQIPIFIAHGTDDLVVPYAFGKATYTILKQAGYPINWHHYPMPHAICEAEIQDLSKWLAHIVATQK